MPELPPLILLVLALLATVGVIECLRAIAVLVRDESAIHDLMVKSAHAKMDYSSDDDEVCGVDVLD